MALTLTGETLDAFNIARNVIYSFMLFVTSVITAYGLAIYEWIKTDATAMEKSGIRVRSR